MMDTLGRVLTAKGTYFEGIVEDARTEVTQNTNDTVTTFGTRTSRKMTIKVGIMLSYQLLMYTHA